MDEVSNVNLSDIKDNNKFGLETLSSKDDVRALQGAAAVAVVDWSSNSLGTSLACICKVGKSTAFY